MNLAVKIKRLKAEAKLPSYAHPGDVGLDLYALERKVLAPGEHHIFFLGFALEFPTGYAGIIKDKGGVAKAGLHTLGGVYDAGYRGEYNVHLVNLSNQEYVVEPGQKIAQLVLYPVAFAEFAEVAELSDSSRGDGRWGSTGR
jgi:dUTP pyrophosphatase